MTKMTVRDESADFAKGIVIIAVSFGHIMPNLYAGRDIVTTFCYSFELAVFFLVSGYLQFGKPEREPRDHIKRSAVSLLYPYVVFSAVIFLFESIWTYIDFIFPIGDRNIISLLSQGFVQYLRIFPVRICSALTWGAGAC